MAEIASSIIIKKNHLFKLDSAVCPLSTGFFTLIKFELGADQNIKVLDLCLKFLKHFDSCHLEAYNLIYGYFREPCSLSTKIVHFSPLQIFNFSCIQAHIWTLHNINNTNTYSIASITTQFSKIKTWHKL